MMRPLPIGNAVVTFSVEGWMPAPMIAPSIVANDAVTAALAKNAVTSAVSRAASWLQKSRLLDRPSTIMSLRFANERDDRDAAGPASFAARG